MSAQQGYQGLLTQGRAPGLPPSRCLLTTSLNIPTYLPGGRRGLNWQESQENPRLGVEKMYLGNFKAEMLGAQNS